MFFAPLGGLSRLFTGRNAALGGLGAMALWGVGATIWIGTRGWTETTSPGADPAGG